MRFYCLDSTDWSVQRAALENNAGETVQAWEYFRGVVSLAKAQADIRPALAARVQMDCARGMEYAQGFNYGKWTADQAVRQANRKKRQQ